MHALAAQAKSRRGGRRAAGAKPVDAWPHAKGGGNQPQDLRVQLRVRELKSVVQQQEDQLKDKQKEIERLMRMLEFEEADS